MALDTLDIEISAKSSDGYRSLNNLIGKLEKMNELLGNMNLSGFKQFNDLLKTDIGKYANGIKTIRSSIVALSKVESKNLKTLKKDLEDLAKADLSGLGVLKNIDFSGISKATAAVEKLKKTQEETSKLSSGFTIHRWTDNLTGDGGDDKQSFTYDNDNYEKAQEKARKEREREAKKAETLVKGTALTIQQYKELLERKISIPKVDVSSLEEAQKQLDKWNAIFEQKSTAIDNKEAMGIAPTQSEVMKLIEASKYIDALEDKITELKQTGGESMRSLGESIKYGLKGAFTGALVAIPTLMANIPNIVNGVKKIGNYMNNLLGVVKKLASGFKSVATKIGQVAGLLGHGTRSSDMFHMSFNKGLKTLLRYGFGIRSTFVLINKLRSAMKEGFKALAVYSAETNTAISNIMTALNGVKGSLAAAFNPILTAVEPILTKFINLLSSAFTKVGEFFSALTGKSMSVKAIATPVNYAQSLDTSTGNAKNNLGKSADNAKKLAKELSVLPFDELNQLNGDKDSSGSSGSGSGSGGNSGSQTDFVATFTDIPVSENIKEFVEKLKKAWEDADFTEIGGILGKKLADALDNIPWNAIQENARKVGKSLATLINGFVETEGLASKIGATIGNAFQTALETVRSFVLNLHWGSVGTALGSGLASFFKTYHLEGVGETIGEAIKGAFELAVNFAKSFVEEGGLDALLDGVFGGIAKVIEAFNWATSTYGRDIYAFALKFVTTLCDKFKEVPWYQLGEAIGNLFNSIPWGTVLKSTISALWDAITDLFAGLWNSGTAGKIASAIGAVFLAVKVADITGISLLVGKIGNLLMTKFLAGGVSKAVETGLSKALATGTASMATESAVETACGTSMAKIGTLVGNLFVPAAAVAGAAALGTALGMIVQNALGGEEAVNLMRIGGAIKSLSEELSNAHVVSSEQQSELNALVDQWVSAGKTSEEIYSGVTEKLKEYGVSADEAARTLANYNAQSGLTEEELEKMRSAFAYLGEGVSETSGIFDASTIPITKMRDALQDALYEASLKDSSFRPLIDTLGELTSQSGQTSQGLYDGIIQAMKDMGLPTETIIGLIGEQFPDAVVKMNTANAEAQSSTKITAESAGSLITAFANVGLSVIGLGVTASREMKGVKTSVEKNTLQAQQQLSSNVATMKADTETNIGEANSIFSEKFENIGATVYEKMSYAAGIVYKENNIIQDDFTSSWSANESTVRTYMQRMSNAIGQEMSVVKAHFYGVVESVKSYFNGLYTVGHNAAVELANGISSVHIPMPHINVDSYAYADGESYSYRMSSSVNWYKRGGFPVGEIWGMNEQGNPEMVGKLGNGNNNTAVANNAIIVEAIEGGVENAMNRFAANFLPQLNNREGGAKQVVHSHIYLDKRKIAEAVDEVREEDNYRFAY